MGMFDSLYDRSGNEWQTKAFACNLDRYNIGDRIGECLFWDLPSYQVEVLGGGWPLTESFATIRDCVLVEVPAARDEALELIDYGGGLVPAYRKRHKEAANG